MRKMGLICFITLSVLSLTFAKTKRGANADLTAYLNSSDADEICKNVVAQIISSPRIVRFSEKNNRDPVVTIGKIRDETGEFFDTQVIANSLKTAVLKSGVLEFMANKDIRDDMRNEVVEQLEHSNEDKAKALDNEDAADYMLTGSVKLMIQNSGKIQERTYIVNVELTDLQTHRTVDMFEPTGAVRERLHKQQKIKSR